MTEQEWLACTDPTPMLVYLQGEPIERKRRRKARERKLRLFALACCWRVWHVLTDDRSRRAVEALERYVEKRATETELLTTWDEAIAAAEELNASTCHKAAVVASSVAEYAQNTERASSEAAACAIAFAKDMNLLPGTLDLQERTAQAGLLRDMFGNPFRPVSLDSAWQTPTVLALAQAIYDERAFDRLPLLADALDDAGSTDADILTHCRDGGKHVRGCWVVDMLPGKS